MQISTISFSLIICARKMNKDSVQVKSVIFFFFFFVLKSSRLYLHTTRRNRVFGIFLFLTRKICTLASHRLFSVVLSLMGLTFVNWTSIQFSVYTSSLLTDFSSSNSTWEYKCGKQSALWHAQVDSDNASYITAYTEIVRFARVFIYCLKRYVIVETTLYDCLRWMSYTGSQEIQTIAGNKIRKKGQQLVDSHFLEAAHYPVLWTLVSTWKQWLCGKKIHSTIAQVSQSCVIYLNLLR